MNFVRPFVRFRFLRSEQFHEGCLQRARQHVSFEFGAASDLRGEVAQLKQAVSRLAVDQTRQKAALAMARATPPAPALVAPPVPASLPCYRLAPAPMSSASGPVSLRSVTSGAAAVFVVIADQSRPEPWLKLAQRE